MQHRIQLFALTGLLASALAVSSLRAGAQRRPAPAAPVITLPTPPAKPLSGGTFTDSAGSKHSWQINAAHALIWDSAPYLPVGGRFVARSLQSDADAAWQEDVRELGTLKAKGVRDLIVWPTRSLPDIAPAALQRLMSYLDANDFRYGLSFGLGLTAPLTGTVVRPAAYRYSDTKESLTATWQTPNTDHGLFVLADATDDNKIAGAPADVPVHDSLVSIPLELPATGVRFVALFYPHKSLPVQGDGTLPDLWGGFDSYRDRLLNVLGQVKFGKGLRFFLDPLARRLGLAGETDFLVPDSESFRLEWEGFLARRYPNLDEARQAWGLTEGDFNSARDLARLIPLWANGRGVPYLYDPIERKTYRILDVTRSQWWQDFLEGRNESILYTMNATADLLKRQVADVPVVYTWTQTHAIFWNTNASGGYDGLAIAAHQRGATLLAQTVGPALSEAEQAARTQWLLATEAAPADTTPPARPAASAPSGGAPVAPAGVKAVPAGYQAGGQDAAGAGGIARPDLDSQLENLRRAGIKGFFAGVFQPEPDAHSWLIPPEDLDWMQEAARRLEGDPDLARYMPRLLFYPQSAPGPAQMGFVSGESDVFWLSSFYAGKLQDWWPSYSGYSILTAPNTLLETVLVSLEGRRVTHLWCAKPKTVRAFTPDGAPVPVKVIGPNTIEVTLEATPTVLVAEDLKAIPEEDIFIPEEGVEDILQQLTALFQIAKLQKTPGLDTIQPAMDHATADYRVQNLSEAYLFARSAIGDLIEAVKPYIWIEGEQATVHTFTEVASNPQASNGMYLRLSTSNPPSRFGYGVHYQFDVPSDGHYTIWLAGTVPGPGVSPIKWRINSDPEQDPADLTPRGPLYMEGRMGWIQLGAADLKQGPGQHLSIYVTDRAANPPDYVFSIDAILITPRTFTPDGPVRPLPLDPEEMRRATKEKAPKESKKTRP
ncbi:MAG TPA: hypothetical protein VKT32_16555 [Chthonomonadaceae bacterium]|nr:hypothetical protein [Chthonomonadaceae bacterium]